MATQVLRLLLRGLPPSPSFNFSQVRSVPARMQAHGRLQSGPQWAHQAPGMDEELRAAKFSGRLQERPVGAIIRSWFQALDLKLLPSSKTGRRRGKSHSSSGRPEHKALLHHHLWRSTGAEHQAPPPLLTLQQEVQEHLHR